MRHLMIAIPTTLALLVTPAAASAGRSPGASAAAERADGQAAGVVNLNTATEEELQLLPGVGPTRAAAIVAYRKRHGNFRKVEELTRVKGFGLKTLRKLKPYLTVSGPTTFKGRKSARPDEGFLNAPPAMDPP